MAWCDSRLPLGLWDETASSAQLPNPTNLAGNPTNLAELYMECTQLQVTNAILDVTMTPHFGATVLVLAS